MVVIGRTIECESCGVAVETIRTTTRFCSNKCRLRARKIKTNGRKKCKRCNKSIMGLQNINYCSEECKEKYMIGNRTIRLVFYQCKTCGCYGMARRKKLYCSGECRKQRRKEWYEEWYKQNANRISKESFAVKDKYSLKCKECGCFFTTTKSNKFFCNRNCNNRYQYRKQEVKRRKRISTNGNVDWSISIGRLTKRDGKRCYLCNEEMNYKVHSNHDDYPSIEHVKPISKGGTHTWDNVKLAHRKCNVKKSNDWEI